MEKPPPSPSKSPVACFGETLWDNLPSGLFLGGAPLNVAYHLAQLGREAILISSVGSDELGRLALERARKGGIDIGCVQIHPTLPTGIVDASIGNAGDATYRIRECVAWDEIESTRLTVEKLREAKALVYGTLASRSPQSRSALQSLMRAFEGLKVCDINLRPPYDDPKRALQLAGQANVLKLNEEELRSLAPSPADGLDEAVRSLYDALERVALILVTRGAEPAILYAGDRLVRAAPHPPEAVVDTVGAGDAFTAALIDGLLCNKLPQVCLERATKLGSYVASRPGAQPDYDPEAVFGD